MRKKAIERAPDVKKIHGANENSQVVAHQGATLFYNIPSQLFARDTLMKKGSHKMPNNPKKGRY